MDKFVTFKSNNFSRKYTWNSSDIDEAEKNNSNTKKLGSSFWMINNLMILILWHVLQQIAKQMFGIVSNVYVSTAE